MQINYKTNQSPESDNNSDLDDHIVLMNSVYNHLNRIQELDS